MIKTDTVLILGAGASRPFNFPTGQGLLDEVYQNLRAENTAQFKQLLEFEPEVSHIRDFRNALKLSGKESIDAFLEGRNEFMRIGKLAIAQTLLPYETTENLFRSNTNWYSYLYNHKLNCSLEKLDNNNLSIITFNYDRSFEHYLFTVFKNSSGLDSEYCADQLKKIPIVHVHGKLGDLPWESPSGIMYDSYEFFSSYSRDSTTLLKKSYDKIKIISEDIENDSEFKMAHNLIEDAEVIYFMGFGYNRTNLQRLRVLELGNGKQMHGTYQDFSTPELTALKKDTEGKIALHNVGCYSFIRNLSVFI